MGRVTAQVRQQVCMAVLRAVAGGKLKKPERCQRCRVKVVPRFLQAHHFKGYRRADWLRVRWLCRPCPVIVERGWRGKGAQQFRRQWRGRESGVSPFRLDQIACASCRHVGALEIRRYWRRKGGRWHRRLPSDFRTYWRVRTVQVCTLCKRTESL